MSAIISLFKGRLNRKNFLIRFLFYFIFALTYLMVVVVSFDQKMNYFLIHAAVYILLVVYVISIYVRRVHDTGNSGLWIILAVLVPGASLVLLGYSLIKKGDVGGNKYGLPQK